MSLTSRAASARTSAARWKAGGEVRDFTGGQLWWTLHDAGFKELIDTRGKDDVESPTRRVDPGRVPLPGQPHRGPRQRHEGQQCFDVFPAAGKILLQSEGFEIDFRRFELQPVSEK